MQREAIPSSPITSYTREEANPQLTTSIHVAVESYKVSPEPFLLQKSHQKLEWAVQGGVWATVPGGVQEMCRCGTKEHGLVGSTGGRWMVELDNPRGLFQP